VRPTVAILGWYGSPNLGDEAELAAILDQLAALRPPPAVTVFSHRPAHTRAAHDAYAGGLRVLARNPFAPAALRALHRSRLLILGGGGLIQDQTSVYNLPIFTVFGVVAAALRCPLFWWGVGVEPLVTAFGRAQARLLVRLAPPGGVRVRDAQSRRILLAAGVPPARVVVSADPAVTRYQGSGIRYQGFLTTGDNLAPDTPQSARIESQTTDHGPRATERVAFCVRDWPNNPQGGGVGYLLPVAAQRRLGLGGRAGAAHGRRAAAFYAQLAAAADHMIERYGVQVLFVSLWPGRDDAIAAQVRGQMRHADCAPAYAAPLTPAQARALLGTMDLVVAVRLHALIFAAAAGVPGVGFAYARKIRGFMARTGQADAVLDPATLTQAQLTATLDRVWAQRAALRVTLKAHMAQLQALAAGDAAWVRAWLAAVG